MKKDKKEVLTRSEYHGVITSYAGLVLSLIAIVLSVITMYQSHVMETREIVHILRAEDDGYYHFDGEKLFRNFQVTIANNSAIPVSVVEITVERDGETQTFEIADLPNVLPLNMESGHTEMITIPWNIELSEENEQTIREHMEETESDAIFCPSKATFVSQKVLALSITLHTAKNHQYILTTEDKGAPESEQGEGLWVANYGFFIQNPQIYEMLWRV